MSNKLTNLSERELLILLNEKVERLEQEVSSQKAFISDIKSLEMRVLEFEVKWRIWSAILGFLAGVGGSIIPKLFNF